MIDLKHEAEVERIAQLVHLPVDDVAYLRKLEIETLHEIRDAIIARLYDEHAAGMGAVATATTIVPPQVSAAIAHRVFTPKLCARIAAHLDPKRAVEISKRVPPEFLAEVALELDPRRADEILRRFPSKLVVDVAELLFPRHEYVAMGRFVDFVSEKAIAAVIDHTHDYAGLLHISMFVEDPERIDLVVQSMTPNQIRSIMKAALAERELWPIGLSLVEEVGAEQRARLASALVPVMLDEVERDPAGGWEEAAEAYEMAGESTREAILETARALDPAIRERAIATADSAGLADHLPGELVEALR